jgi:hypothetical protein
MNKTDGPADRQALQKQIVALVTEFEAALKTAQNRVPRIFRSLCRLAQAWQMNAEEFRCRLVRAGLPASRASEIKTVLSVDTISARFISGDMTWRKALSQARNHLQAQEGIGPTEQLAAKIVAMMHRARQPVFEINEGTFELICADFPLIAQNRTHNK